ncbi:hypothetical protein FS837_009920 [Tulasnella sp. UAMH 9824]|nr:hypothetical protein FS837_009920 [Tulasnella sp. UAMH 9824]
MPKERREQVDVTSALKNILDNYPAGSATLREILQNTDDAGAKKQVFALGFYTLLSDLLINCHTRKFGLNSLVGGELHVCQGPAIIATNDGYFKPQDWDAITTILDSSKKQDETSTGKYGLGFRSCYHITDNPHILSGDKLLILDPHARVKKFKGGFELDTKHIENEDGEIERNMYEDHFATFSAVFRRDEEVYPGTAIRLPLRLKGFESKLKSTPTMVEDARKMFKDFIAKELPEAMLFLKNITEIKLLEIDEYGNETVSATAMINDAGVVASHRKRTKQGEVHHYPITITMRIGSAPPFTRSWIITQFSEKDATASGHLAKRLKRIQRDVEAAMFMDKLLPQVALALPLPAEGANSSPKFHGRLFTLLPLPIITSFPVHINAVLALVSSRQNLRNSMDVETGSREELLVEWNRVIFSELVPKAWVALLEHLVIQSPSSVDVFEAWPGLVSTKDGDQGYWNPLPPRLLEEAAHRAVWPSHGRSSEHATLNGVLVAVEGESYAPLQALEACNVPLVLVPERVFSLIKQSGFKKAILSPHSAYTHLKRNTYTISDPDAATRKSICDYLVSANDICLLDLPLIPQVQGEYTSILSHAKYVMATKSEAAMFGNVDQRLLAEDSMSAGTRQLLLSDPARRVQPVGPADVARYLERQVPIAGRTSLATISSGVNPRTFEWLIEFWAWLDGWDKFDQLVDHSAAWGTIQNLHALPLRSTGGKSALRLVGKSAVRPRSLDDRTVEALAALKVPMLDASMSNGPAVRFVSKDHSDVTFILQSVPKNTSFLHLDQTTCRTLFEFFTQQLSNYLQPYARRFNRVTINNELCSVLRNLPIFPTLNPGFRDDGNITFDIAPDGACFVNDSVRIIPNIRGTPFVSYDFGRTFHLALKERDVLGEIDVLQKAIGPDAWGQQDQVTGLLPALIGRLINCLNEVDDVTRIKISDLAIVEVGATARRKSPNQVVDPASPIAELYDPEDEVLPAGVFGRGGPGSYIHQLQKYNMLRVTLTASAIEERITRISDQSRPMKGRSEKALRLLRVLDSYTLSEGDGLPFKVVKMLCDLAWLPVVNRFYRPSECWDSRGEDLLLCDMVSPSVPLTVSSQQLRDYLGWNEVPFDTLQRQLLEVLETKPRTSQLPETDIMERIEAVLKEIAQRFQAGGLSQEQIESLAETLGDAAWVPTNSRNRCVARQGMLGEIDVGMRYHSVAPYLLRSPGMEMLLRHMGIFDRPSQASLLSTLREISNELSENGINQPTQNELLHASIKILNELGHTMEGEEFQFQEILIPTEGCKLALAPEVLFNDMAGSLTVPPSGFRFAHPLVSASLASTLGLRRISEEDFDEGGDGIQSFHIGEDLTVRIRGVLQDYGIDHSSNEWVANAEDAGAKSLTYLVDEASFGGRVIGGLTGFQSGPALVMHNDGVFTDEDFSGLGNIGQGGKAGKADSIGRFGLGALSFYHFSETLFRFPLRTADQAAESKLSATHFSPVDITNQIGRFYAFAKQSLFFPRSLRTITALRRTPDLRTIPFWSAGVTREPIPYGVPGDMDAVNILLELRGPHSSHEITDHWIVTRNELAKKEFPVKLQALFPLHRLPTPTFGLAVNLSVQSRPSSSRLFATLPLPVATSLPVHVHATWILAQDRRSIRYDAPDAAGQRPDDTLYNQYLLEKGVTPLYVRTLALILQLQPEVARHFWPGKPNDDISRTVFMELYEQIISTKEPVLLSVRDERISPTDSIIHSSKAPVAVRKILSKLQAPNYVPTPFFDTSFRNNWETLVFDSGEAVSKILQENVVAMRQLWQADAFTLKDILSVLDYLVEEKESLDGIPLLVRGDRELVEFRSSGAGRVFASHRTELAKLFGPSTVVSLEISDLAGQNLVKQTVNVGTLDSGGMQDLLLHRGLAVTPIDQMAPSGTQRDWHNNLLKFLASPGCPVKVQDLADYPLLPAVGQDLVVSLNHARGGRIWWRHPYESQTLTTVLLQLGVISVDDLPEEPREPDVNDLTRILRLFGQLNLSSEEVLRRVTPKDWDAFVQYLKPWIQDLYLRRLSEFDIQVLNTLPFFLGRQGNTLSYVPASQVMMLPDSVPLDTLAQYLPQETTFAESGSELAAVLRAGRNTQRSLSFSSLFNQLRVPRQLARDEDDTFSSLLPLVATHHTGTYENELIPDGNRVVRRPSELFDHRVALFSTAYEGREDLFVHPDFRGMIDGLVSLGVQREITSQRLLECIQAVDQEARQGREVVRRARWLWDYVNTAPQELREISFDTIRTLCFIPRHIQRHPSDSNFDVYAGELPDVVSPDEICVPNRETVAWTQRARFATLPSAHLTAVYPNFGEPSPTDVVRHLASLANQVAHDRRQSSILLSNIRSVYRWLGDNRDNVTGLLRPLANQRLWLNISRDSDDWTWRAADELVFDLTFDVRGRFVVQDFLLPYRSLLVGAGAHEYRVASPPPPSTSEVPLHHLERMRSGWNTLRRNGILLDICFQVEGQEIPAHKGMLAALVDHFMVALSGVFSESTIFSNETNLPVYTLPQGDPASAFAVRSVVDYVYTGTFCRPEFSNLDEADAALDDLLNLMELSILWEIPELSNQAVDAILALRLIRFDNCQDVFARAEACQMEVLINICQRTMEQNHWAER